MTTPQRTKRIGSIDGLKGLAAVFILVFHYLLAFAPYGHIGFGSGVAKQNAEAVYMASFPYFHFGQHAFCSLYFLRAHRLHPRSAIHEDGGCRLPL
ncbi:MAG: hypothetical protein MR890_03080 [Akkermansia muciniphila]|nr:hypothetical protein [Akkermansia muciniphila]